jgi:hypothetical protein
MTVHLKTSLRLRPQRLSTRLDVLHHLPGFGFDASGDDFHRARHDSQLAREIEHLAHAHGVGERKVRRPVSVQPKVFHGILPTRIAAMMLFLRTVSHRNPEARNDAGL